MLPHRYPFELLDRSADDRVVVGLTAGAGVVRGGAEWPPVLALEALAQAAMVLLAEPGEAPARGALAGIDQARLPSASRPLLVGDRLAATVERRGAFGRLLKVHGRLERDGESVVEADLILALG